MEARALKLVRSRSLDLRVVMAKQQQFEGSNTRSSRGGEVSILGCGYNRQKAGEGGTLGKGPDQC